MADPVTIALATAAVAGTASSIFGSFGQRAAVQAQAEMANQALDDQAMFLRIANARKKRQIEGAITARTGARGIRSTGSPMATIVDSLYVQELDTLNKVSNIRAQQRANAAGLDIKIGAIDSGIGASLITGGAQVFSAVKSGSLKEDLNDLQNIQGFPDTGAERIQP